MRIQVEARALREERRYTEQQAKKIVIACKRRLREVSLATERRVKQEMPVDTGRARASWGHWAPGHLRMMTVTSSAGEKVRVSRAAWTGDEPTDADAVWEVKDDGLTIVQGSNVPYIEQLNAGHSAQATRGFIDRAEERAMELLDGYIDEIMREF